MTIDTLGIYWDRAPGDTDRYVAMLEELPAITHAHLMMGSASGRELADRWGPRDTGKLAERLAGIGVGLVCTVWWRPTRESTAQIAPVVRAALAAGAIAIEIEGEGNVTTSRVDGYHDLAAAVDALWDAVDAADPAHQLERRVTCHLGRLQRELHARADWASFQAYSKDTPDDDRDDWGADLGPGWRQVAAYDRVRQIRGLSEIHRALYRANDAVHPIDVPDLVARWLRQTGLQTLEEFRGSVALPLWGQAPYPGDPQISLEVAWDTAEALGATRVELWSAKHLRAEYARDWVRSLPLDRHASTVTQTSPTSTVTQDPAEGRRLYQLYVDARIATDIACEPIAPWLYLDPRERAVWVQLAASLNPPE